jgi:HD-GYP domain-containing protein (c-di-GMP phosphodiesterase class II)
MANVLVWGKTRELLAGDLPEGLVADEVDSLAQLKAAHDTRNSTLILIDPRRLESEAGDFESWARDGAARRALLVAVAERTADAAEVARRFPAVDDVLVRPVSAAYLRLRLDRALDIVNSRRVIHQLGEALGRKSQELTTLNHIGVALSAERDVTKLLDLILAKCRAITSADAGSLYLVERGKDPESSKDDHLQFKLTQNDSVTIPFEERTMPLSESSISGYAALTGQSVNVADAYHLPAGTPFQISSSFDEKWGYRTKSMLVVPMRDHEGAVIGVVQLINKKREAQAVLQPVALVDEIVIPFTAVDEELVSSLASQAAVAFENAKLLQDIRDLFESFVSASVKAIESRDPTTSGHSGRVATLTVGLAEVMDALTTGPFKDVSFTRDQVQEIKYASLLHDFGKVGVREKVLIKGKKLYVGEMLLIRQRFAYMRRTLEAEHLRLKLDKALAGELSPSEAERIDREYRARQKELEDLLQEVVKSNEPSLLGEDRVRTLIELTNRTFTDIDGHRQTFLTTNEAQALSIPRGSLSEKERREIESHVTHTFAFLSEIRWTGSFRRVPEIAYAHHEKMDGTGYPRRLSAPDIPIQSRMMTVSDIYDALVAWDRPYKKAVPTERALDILRDESRHGKIDTTVLDLFVEARVFERTIVRPA